MVYHLAIDIGASSGRHLIGCIRNGKLVLEEIYRFENGIKNLDGALTWDIEQLFEEVLTGIAKCKSISKIPSTIAIDTWGVDYVLLDKNRQEIMPCFAYRDEATSNVQAEVSSIVSRDELYRYTGIQHQNFNSIYRLYCDKKLGRLEKAEYMLMMPEYLSFKLTGNMCREYTNATTTGLINAKTRDWDWKIINKLGYPNRLFGNLVSPPSKLGKLKSDIAEKVGFESEVLMCPSHDTAAAVLACPMDKQGVYISSGTWSLLGAETYAPITTSEAQNANFTNEGGVGSTYRFLKNIMGMWIFQGVRKSIEKRLNYDEMMKLAEKSDYTKIFDPNDPSLNAPKDMLSTLRALLNDPNLPLEDALSSVYHSLARSYSRTIGEIENILNQKINSVHIIGGGCKDEYLNALTAQYTGKTVTAGPIEATAIGNLVSQIMYCDKKIDVMTARAVIKSSFAVKIFNGGLK